MTRINASSFCECKSDGYCSRYNRTMTGRFREICAGINCDLGTAAAFRTEWLTENITKSVNKSIPIPLLLKTNQAPGDAVVMTAAIYSLHKAHPGKYLTAVESPYPEVFAYNPDVVPLSSIPDALHLEMHYPAIHYSNQRGIHFMQGFCEFLGSALGIHVPLLTNRPHLYFPDPDPPVDEYWVVCSGGKPDLTNKLWGYKNYVRVLYELIPMSFVQVGNNHIDHPRLHGVYNLVGQTNLRQLFDIVRSSRGVLCGVSLLMHVAAALDKPAIVIAGGREPVQWNAYPKQHYLHTVGMLPCTDMRGNSGACWRSRTIPQGDNEVLDNYPCLYPIENTPKCMTMIKPEQVASLILECDRQYE